MKTRSKIRFLLMSLLAGVMIAYGLLTLNAAHAQDAAPAAADAAAAVIDAAAAATEEAKPLTPADESAKMVADALATPTVAIDTVWTLICGMLVFFMNLGFAMVESGLARAKNTVNILAKNFIVFAISTLGFYIMGWGLMFGNGNAFIGTSGVFFVSGTDYSPLFQIAGVDESYAKAGELAGEEGVYASIAWAGVPLWCKFFFQLVFCGTAATIVSGAVAERIKFHSFLLFSFVLTAFIYPVVGHMIWGGGYLYTTWNMLDFAGSTVVHSVGGWAALAGVLVLGPRMGKYNADGSSNPIPAHNMTSVCLGGLILWFGWYGFNPGSTMAAVGYAAAISHVAVTTTLAAAIATVAAAVTSWFLQGKPDFSMIVNGTLAGLVGITAPCAYVSPTSALIIGLVAGVLVVFAVITFDKLKLDDPVGALSVHLVNGIWGTLALGLFAYKDSPAGSYLINGEGLLISGESKQLVGQLVGVIAAGATTFVISIIAWLVIKAIFGLRVTDEEQIEGLDLGEHDQAAYPDFQQTYIKSYHVREA